MKRLTYLIITITLVACGTSTGPDKEYGKPTDLQAEITLIDQIKLTWSDNSDLENGFVIQRKQEQADFGCIDTVSTDIFEYFDDNIEYGINYTYRVAALFGDYLSEWSEEVEIFSEDILEFGLDTTLDAVTWNIQNFPKAGQVTVTNLARSIYAIDADLVCLQEIESEYYFEQLVQELNNLDTEDQWLGYRAASAYAEINLACIYKEESLNNIQIYEIFTSGSYSRPFPRAPLVVEAEYAGEPVFFINNHFKAGGDGQLDLNDPWDDETRRFEASNLLNDFIEDSLETNNVVILGDLNDELTDITDNNVFITFLNDTENYLFADYDIALGSQVDWSYPSWPSHLDHILITNELFDEFNQQNSLVQTIKMDAYFEDWYEYDNLISDHRPVGIRLNFN